MERVPFFTRPKLRQQLNEYHEFIEEMIEMKKKQYNESTEKSKDLITAFIESNEKEGEFKLTRDEVRVIYIKVKDIIYLHQIYYRIISPSLF
jgi:cytochrome P450